MKLSKLLPKKIFTLACWCGLGSLVLVLAACSSTQILTVQQQVFEQWPGQAQGQSYTIVSPQSRSNDLEYSNYVQLLRSQMSRIGLSEANSAKNATFQVSFSYTIEPRQQIVRGAYYDDDLFFSPFAFYPGFGFGYWGSYYYYSGMNVMMRPQYYARQVDYNRYSLVVTIRQSSSGRDVYKVTVITDSMRFGISQFMPYLMSAAFDNFPGYSGQVREIDFDLKAKQNEKKPSAETSKKNQTNASSWQVPVTSRSRS